VVILIVFVAEAVAVLEQQFLQVMRMLLAEAVAEEVM
jgi:hypothetical protein